jgi:hypothetical protein
MPSSFAVGEMVHVPRGRHEGRAAGELLDRLRRHRGHRQMRSKRVPVNVDASRFGQPRLALDAPDPEPENLRRQLALVGLEHTGATLRAKGS